MRAPGHEDLGLGAQLPLGMLNRPQGQPNYSVTPYIADGPKIAIRDTNIDGPWICRRLKMLGAGCRLLASICQNDTVGLSHLCCSASHLPRIVALYALRGLRLHPE